MTKEIKSTLLKKTLNSFVFTSPPASKSAVNADAFTQCLILIVRTDTAVRIRTCPVRARGSDLSRNDLGQSDHQQREPQQRPQYQLLATKSCKRNCPHVSDGITDYFGGCTARFLKATGSPQGVDCLELADQPRLCLQKHSTLRINLRVPGCDEIPSYLALPPPPSLTLKAAQNNRYTLYVAFVDQVKPSISAADTPSRRCFLRLDDQQKLPLSLSESFHFKVEGAVSFNT
ncbi:hypothetical protein EGW08_003573 [Elysia chlorotica]|uniref:Uncharacterized protein n=1 Tax=Elysia chlorotica TaxID=188477 RepID=A0A433U4G7_ELYCH|nr:hypothetical protein EGW08_003573 [Elysia chlorotica]